MSGIASLPGFDESLRLLLNDERYSLTDIGMMFGVTRERVRQIAQRLGLGTQGEWRGLHHVRVWDDTLNRFRPIRKGDVRDAKYRRGVEERRAARQVVKAERRARIIAITCDLSIELSRAPTLGEIATAFKGRPAGRNEQGVIVAYAFSGKGNRRSGDSYAEVTAELYRLAGTEVRGVGGRGHVGPRGPRTHCVKGGHELIGDNVALERHGGAVVRLCRECRRIRRMRRYRHLRDAANAEQLTQAQAS